MGKKIFRGESYFGAINVGGSAIVGIKTGTLSVVVGNVGAGTTGTASTTLTGAAVGDVIILNPTTPTNGVGLGGARLLANSVQSYWVNAGASEAAAGTVTCRYVWFDHT